MAGYETRVVITGLGALTPIGANVDEYWKALCGGVSGSSRITRFDPDGYASQFACEVKGFDPLDHMSRKLAHRLDPYSQYALVAGREALDDAGIDPETMPAEERERTGTIIGSGIGGITSTQKEVVTWHEQGPRRVSPLMLPLIISNMAGGMAAIEFGFKGPSYCTVSACATGNNSLCDAYMIIQQGYAETVLCGSSEACIVGSVVAGFNSMKALSTRNDSPETASRPFDATRDGFVMGEGAGMFVLESLEHAQKRGARIYAEILGFGMSTDAHHMTAPEPEGSGAAQAMRRLLQDSNIKPEEVDYLNMHGTSTTLGDIAETKAIKKVFGDHAHRMKISSTKSMTGHMIGAAASAEAIASILAMRHGTIPPTTNFNNPDPDCDLDYTFNKAVEVPVNIAVSNSFGFGGHNTTAAFRKWDEA